MYLTGTDEERRGMQTITAKDLDWSQTLAPGAVASAGGQASRPSGITQLPTGLACTAS
jgi:hypothetical protein